MIPTPRQDQRLVVELRANRFQPSWRVFTALPARKHQATSGRVWLASRLRVSAGQVPERACNPMAAGPIHRRLAVPPEPVAAAFTKPAAQ